MITSLGCIKLSKAPGVLFKIPDGRFGARGPPGHSEHSRNAFRAEPFRTFRSPWQPSRRTVCLGTREREREILRAQGP